MILFAEWKEALRDKFVTAAPRRSGERLSISRRDRRNRARLSLCPATFGSAPDPLCPHRRLQRHGILRLHISKETSRSGSGSSLSSGSFTSTSPRCRPPRASGPILPRSTDSSMHLRGQDVEPLVITGGETDVCVLATAARPHRPRLSFTDETHDASLKLLESRFTA